LAALFKTLKTMDMELLQSVKKNGKILVSVRAYKGDAMTFLTFDLHKDILNNFVGFSIHIKANMVNGNYKLNYFLLNRLTFKQDILDKNQIDDKEKLSSEYSPFQKFNWVHVPSTDHYFSTPYFGDYTYTVTPRYLEEEKLLPLDPALSVELTFDVSPFNKKGTKLGFARAFISSQAYIRRFGMNNQMRPNNNKLRFNIKDTSGKVKIWDSTQNKMVDDEYSYEEQHKYLGWQARERVMEFLDEVLDAPDTDKMSLEVFAYDLNEPLIVTKLGELAGKGKLRIILDNAGSHAKKDGFEGQFEDFFNEKAIGNSAIERGKYGALSHSKVMIQKKNGKAVKVLTGSTNFSTNGFYINANHIIIFDNQKVAQLYSDVFNDSFGQELMNTFKLTKWATDDFIFESNQTPDITIRFAPHDKDTATKIFNSISTKIKGAKSDVLFAIMQDTSISSILDAVRAQVENPKVFTYGITDIISKGKDSVVLYKPNSKRGVRIAARGEGVTNVLPKPFNKVPKIDGYAIHHKFVVVDFKGPKPVVYCGSSNLAFNPEQKNGDNLIEIRDREIVTAFAIEAFRLTEHFHWRNKEQQEKEMFLDDLSISKDIWYKNYFNPNDLRCIERELFIRDVK
jgi:phosphatidylserine/phosphatidylglycerophosphate/cardiolipin synthase-like enzyme